MEAVKGNILIVDDEESIRRTFMMFLKQEQYNVSLAANYSEALEHINKTPLDVVFADIMLGEKNGIDVLHAVRQSGLDCPVIMITGDPNVTTASAALRLGAFDYLPKPIRKDRLLQTTQLALQHKKLNEEKQRIVAENDKYRKHLDAIFRSV
ncbi:MAG: response regulator, partial [Calditrichaeota bacterium]|nr:response regulator [Calditrichota bacterium]